MEKVKFNMTIFQVFFASSASWSAFSGVTWELKGNNKEKNKTAAVVVVLRVVLEFSTMAVAILTGVVIAILLAKGLPYFLCNKQK